jgi:hypothetical protein
MTGGAASLPARWAISPSEAGSGTTVGAAHLLEQRPWDAAIVTAVAVDLAPEREEAPRLAVDANRAIITQANVGAGLALACGGSSDGPTIRKGAARAGPDFSRAQRRGTIQCG